MISTKNVLKMESIDVSKKRKFQTYESELSSSSLLPLSKHSCFNNVSCSSYTNDNSKLDSEYSVSYVNSTSMEFNNEIDMKEESSGSCNVDKTMISFESHIDFIYDIRKLENYSDIDIENILYLHQDNEVEECNNVANYVLSSGRWSVNQDSTQHDTTKPTFDQEFEQYFSMLML